MRKIIFIAIIVLLSIVISPYPEIIYLHAVNDVTLEEEPITLYAHSMDTDSPYGDNILRTAPPYGILMSSYTGEGLSFYLYPPLTSNLSIRGSLNCRLWLNSSTSRTSSINISLYEVTQDEDRIMACSAFMNVLAKEAVGEFVFGIPVSHNFTSGSTIQLFIQSLDEAPLKLFWDDRTAPTSITLPIISSEYYRIQIQTVDAEDLPLSYANMTIIREDVIYWRGFTDSNGLAEALLSFIDEEGTYEVKVYWRGILVNNTSIVMGKEPLIKLRCNVYDLDLRIFDLFHKPMNDVVVRLANDSILFFEDTTSENGSIIFKQMPKGNYKLILNYYVRFFTFSTKILEEKDISLVKNETQEFRINYIPERFLNLIIASLILFPVIIFGILRIRGKDKIYRTPFAYFKTLVGGGVPASSAIMIVGNPSSGKTVLLEHLLNESLRKKRSCVFISNLDFPSKIKNSMKEFGFANRKIDSSKRLAFIDCYSETAGQTPGEKYSVPSLQDLTTLGIKISSCLNELGKGTDVFFDSLNPLFPILKQDFILNFIHTISAKVKGNRGRFFFTVGTGIEPEVLSKLESTSDCVIEAQLYEKDGDYQRRLRIKKMGKKHIENWVDFSIEDKKGIVFRLKKKPDV